MYGCDPQHAIGISNISPPFYPSRRENTTVIIYLLYYETYDKSKSEMCLITEYIGGGELFDRVIEDEFLLSEKVRKKGECGPVM